MYVALNFPPQTHSKCYYVADYVAHCMIVRLSSARDGHAMLRPSSLATYVRTFVCLCTLDRDSYDLRLSKTKTKIVQLQCNTN